VIHGVITLTLELLMVKEEGGFKTKKEAQEALRVALNEYEKGGTIIDESNIATADFLIIGIKNMYC